MITCHTKHACVCLDFPQYWTKLDTTGDPRPRARHSHTACCIAGPLTGQEYPLLLVGGGLGKALNAVLIGGGYSDGVLKDMWVLDVDRGVWSQVSSLIVLCMMRYIKSACVLCVPYIHVAVCLGFLV